MTTANTTNVKTNKYAGYLATWPAEMIDKMYLNQPAGGLGRFWSGVKSRLAYAFLFTPLSLVDLVTSRVLATAYSIGSFYTTDDTQERYLKEQAFYANLFSKNLYATLSFPFGLINPKLVAFYFTPEKRNAEGITSGGDFYHSKTATIKHPADVQAVQDIMRKAALKNDKVMPVGAGRSQGKQFIPKGGRKIVVDLDKLSTIEINEEEKTATVGAGVHWIDLQLAADKHKLALQVMQASNVFTVGGSIGTNIHGWDHRAGTLSNSIVSIDIVNAQGEKQTLTPADPMFHQVTGGMGLFGIITKVKIKLTDNELLNEKSKAVPIANYVEHFKNNVANNPDIRMHLYRLSLDPKNLLSTGIAVDYVKENDTQLQVSHDLKPERQQGTRFERVLLNLARRIGWVRKFIWNRESRRLLANDSKPMTRNEIMQPPINAMFNSSVSESEWLQEYFLPGDQLPQFLKILSQILTDNQVVLLNASVRFVKQNPNPALSAYAKDGDRFAVVICFNQSLSADQVLKAKKWLRAAQEEAIKHGGSYYLPYQHISSPEDFNKAYPQAKEALAKKQACDPQERFSSGFYQKYLTPSNQPNYFKQMMATPAMQKKFSGFLENVLQRVDTKKFFALLTDVMKYSDTHAEIYKELCRRLPEIMPSQITAMQQMFGSLSEIKKDLGKQAKELLNGTTAINGLVEIGYPGRFIAGFKHDFKVTGKIVAVHEQESPTDYLQTGFPRPYQQFAPLSYQKPNLATLADNSADVITCYIGLHHFPDNEIDTFLKDVRRVLRPGGKFLLVDHDVIDDEAMTMAHMAHSVFNAVYGATLKAELQETRHFHPITYWQQLLQKYDLGSAMEDPDVPMIRAGDPTRNRMVNFVNQKKLELKHDDIPPAPSPTMNDSVWKIKHLKNPKPSTSGLYKQPVKISTSDEKPLEQTVLNTYTQ